MIVPDSGEWGPPSTVAEFITELDEHIKTVSLDNKNIMIIILNKTWYVFSNKNAENKIFVFSCASSTWQTFET